MDTGHPSYIPSSGGNRHVACIIQARRSSRRMPDKVMHSIGDRRLIEHVIDRARAIEGVDSVIVATVDDAHHDPLAEIAVAAGAMVWRGSKDDVLSRYYGAAMAVQATHVIRITSDCPLLDPTVCAELLEYVIAENGDYGAALQYPHGMDCEAFTMAALAQAHHRATLLEDREHVTLWMKNVPEIRKTHYKNPAKDGPFGDVRLVIDYPQDYAMVQALIRANGGKPPQDYRTCVQLLNDHPDIKAMNANCVDEWAKSNQAIMEARAKSGEAQRCKADMISLKTRASV